MNCSKGALMNTFMSQFHTSHKLDFCSHHKKSHQSCDTGEYRHNIQTYILYIPIGAESLMQINKGHHDPHSYQVCEVDHYTVTNEFASQCIINVTSVLQENFKRTRASRM